MPSLRPLQAQQTPSGSIATTQGIQPLDLSGVARGASAIGQAFKEMKDGQERAIIKLRDDEARLHVVNETNKAQSDWLERMQAAQNADPRESAGLTERTLKDWDAYTQDREKTAPEEAKAMLREKFAGMRTSIHASAFNTEIKQRNTVVAQDVETGIDAARRIAQTQPHRALDLVAQERALIKTLSLPGEARMRLDEIARESIAGDAAGAMAKADPTGFLERAKNPNKDPLLSMLKPESLKYSMNVAEVQIARNQAALAQASEKATREAEKREREAKEATDEVREFNLSGAMPDDAFIASKMEQVRGTQYEPIVTSMLKASAEGAAFGAKSLPAQAAALAALSGKATNPDMQKMEKRARAIHETQTREYAENAWAAASRFHRMPQVQAVTISNGGQGAQIAAERLPLMEDLEANSGKPESPFQPAEAMQWGDALKGMPVPERAQAISAVGNQLTVPRINALAKQMETKDKPFSLALKLPAPVAQILLSGQQAIQDKRVKAEDTAEIGWRAEASPIVRGALGGGKIEDDALDAIFYVRAGLAADGGGDVRQAIRLVLGSDIVDRAGSKFVLPRGMDESTFDDKARALVKGVTTPLYYRGKPITPMILHNRLTQGGMIRDKQGRYTPLVNNAMITLDEKGTIPLALEIK